MSSALLAKGSRRALSQINYVSPVPPGAADGLVARIYAQVERDFGMLAPPVALHSPASATLAAAWVMLRETLLVTGRVSRVEKETVAAAVSAANECPYCVTVHSAVARNLAPDNVTAPLEETARWARSTGRPPAGQHVPVSGFPELAGVAVTFHYLNRMVNVFLPSSPMPSLIPRAAGGWMMRVLGSFMLSSTPVPGAALGLLPEAPLPVEFSWAAGDPRIASALARATAAIEDAGAKTIPLSVREFVKHRLQDWNGEPPGPNRGWANAAAMGLPPADRASGRLAILTALAPYQVVPDDIAEFRSSAQGSTPADEALVTLTSWASMSAGRTVGSWLRAPARLASGKGSGEGGGPQRLPR